MAQIGHTYHGPAVSDIVEAWMWRDPEEIIERLIARSSRAAMRPVLAMAVDAPARAPRDRYYTMWRRCHVKQIMRGRR